MKQIKVGVQASMLKQPFGQIGVFETLKKIGELGYHSVEISQVPMTPENVAQMKRAQEECGVKIAATSASVALSGMPGQETLATHFDKIVRDCRELNCDFIRIGMLPWDCMANLDKVLHFCRMANVAAKKLADEGIKLYYHNHHVEFARFNGKTMLDIIRENAELLGFELDVHWVHRGGCDPVKVIRDYAGKVELIHLKDYRIGLMGPEAFAALGKGDFKSFMGEFRNTVQFAEVGEGTLDMPAIIEASLEAGAKQFFIEQDETYGRDPFDCLVISRDNLNKMGYELI